MNGTKSRNEAAKAMTERILAKRAATATGVRCPTGRVTVTGTILSTRWQDTGYGTALKALILSDEGWRVWGTIPRVIERGAEKGARVTFTATVAPKDGEPLFGFYSRPSKAEILARSEVAA